VTDQNTPHRDSDLLSSLNHRLKQLQREASARDHASAGGECPSPGSVLRLVGGPRAEPEPILLLVLEKLSEDRLRCCKLSWETVFAGPGDLLLDPDEWSGGYAVMIETWNCVEIPTSGPPPALDVVPSEWVSRALRPHPGFNKSGMRAEHLSVHRAPPVGGINERWAFRERERRAALSVGSAPAPSVRRPHSLVSMKGRIGKRYRIDDRAGFEMPCEMALRTPGARMVPVHRLSLSTGEWDVIESKSAGGRIHCVVPSGIATPELVERTELDRIRWVEINRKIFSALSEADPIRRVRGLSRVLTETDRDPYAAFTLSWVLLFQGDVGSALQLAGEAEMMFPLPEFRDLARGAAAAMRGENGFDDILVDVWRCRCTEHDPRRRIKGLKALYLKTGSGYAAYETAMEYRFWGSQRKGNPDYRLYSEVRAWCERALTAAVPLDERIRRWSETIVEKIAMAAPEIKDAEGNRADYYVPLRKSA